ncbi:MAG TPA: nuclear transport factor 2 family protein [Pyrinomonadaceae bacterium]
MKSIFQLLGFALVVTCSPPLVAQSLSDRAPVSQDQRKEKDKDGKTITRDKSKPVRKAIEDWYARNMAAFRARDVAAIMALRTENFHTITPDGRVNTRADMETRTRLFLDRIDHFISQDNQIGTIEVDGDVASADIAQRTVRMQRFPDGTLHKVESAVVQRETWKKTAEGWKLYRVDSIRDGGVLVDDKPYTPGP